MTPEPSTLTRKGTGRGLKVVTRPVTKKRGVSAAPEVRKSTIAENRAKYRNTTNLPIAEVADSVDPDKPLTEKAKLFVKFWAQGESISSAAARAGYGDGATYAYRLVHYPQAKALYAQEKALYEQAAQMTRKKVMDMLVESYDMAKMCAEPSSMVSAAREIGKMCGYYIETKKVELNVSGSVALRKMEQLSDEDLLRLISEGMQATGSGMQELLADDGAGNE